jgi:hypothetical protein
MTVEPQVTLADALALNWDRAVVLPPYSYDEDANARLGFDRFDKEDSLTSGDGTALVLFVRDQSMIAELALYGQSFYFDESIQGFDTQSARFTVRRAQGGLLLTQ